MAYTIVPKRGYVELWIDGVFAGSFDSREEAMAEVNATKEVKDEVHGNQ